MTALAEKASTVPAAVARRARPWPELVLLLGTAVLYLWNLTSSGWANSYYAGATQAASQDWQAWLFGSSDAGNVITVDKPPASLWLSGLFARVFGFSSWSVLVPQALAGVATVWLLYAAVKRVSGRVAGLLAGAALALTPVAALMFRYNQPDALLTLLLVAGAYCTVRAVERASWRWLALAGVTVGFAFLTKMLQGVLTVPALGLAYLVAAPTTLWRRIAHLGVALGAVIVSAGWYVALVALWPTSSRPYIAGSTDDSLLELALGYNGLGRIFGGGRLVGGPSGGNVGFGGDAGPGRMFGAAFGTEVSWLLPAALIGLVAGLWFTRRAARTDRTRAALLLWGGWLLVTAVVFSLMTGIVHPYYAVALAPSIAAVTAISGWELWRGRSFAPARYALAAMVAVTGVWSFILLDRYATWQPWLRWVVVVAAVALAAALAVGAARRAVAVAMAAVMLAGSGAITVATAAEPHTGSIPLSGPVLGSAPMMMGPEPSAELASLLASTTTKWAAATSGGTEAADLALASGKSVIAIGGWNGGDPAPTLAEFQEMVARGEVAYYVGGGMSRGGGSEIDQWVSANYESRSIGDHTIYDLR